MVRYTVTEGVQVKTVVVELCSFFSTHLTWWGANTHVPRQKTELTQPSCLENPTTGRRNSSQLTCQTGEVRWGWSTPQKTWDHPHPHVGFVLTMGCKNKTPNYSPFIIGNAILFLPLHKLSTRQADDTITYAGTWILLKIKENPQKNMLKKHQQKEKKQQLLKPAMQQVGEIYRLRRTEKEDLIENYGYATTQQAANQITKD